VGLAATLTYVQGILNGLQWPSGMQALNSPPPPLACYVQPPNPNIAGGTPTAYTWFEQWRNSRANDKLSAGTIPRASYPGGPSGTRSIVHRIPLYVVWMGGSATDPNAPALFPGMVDAISAVLETTPLNVPAVDPWTGVETAIIDIGEDIDGRGYLRDLEPQMSPQRLDALLSVSVTEIISG
jgi:hypothetical protein